MRRYGWWLFWSLAALLLFFGNGQLWITDSVESNYALTAKEMVLSGDWISPQIYGNYWYDKPVFFYWLTAAGFKIFGFNEFAARFFPALFGMAGLGLLVYAAKKLYGEKTAFWSGVILMTSTEFFLISKSVITDSTLFFFFSMALVFFYLGYSTQQKIYYYGIYTGMALATLTKGPIGFLLPGLIMVLFLGFTRGWREIKNMKVFSGGLLFLLIAAPWYVAMYNLHGSAFIDQFFGTHNFLRATVSEHPRDNVFYYYTLVLLLALFPWSGLLPRFLWRTLREDGKWRRPDEKTGFLLIWAATVSEHGNQVFNLYLPNAVSAGIAFGQIPVGKEMERRNGRHFNCARPYLHCPVWRCAVVLVEQYHQHWHGNFNRCGGACRYRHQLDKHQP